MNLQWKQILGILVLSGAFMLGACAKSDGGGGGGGQIAQTPCNSPMGGNCNPSVYGQDPSLVIPQPYNNGFSNGYCGCGLNYRPIYNPQWGFACAPANTFQYQNYMGYGFNSMYQGQNNGIMTMQQVYYSPLNYGSQYSTPNSCYSDFAAACDIRVPNTCANGGVCRPVGAGSAFGVCTNGGGLDAYNGSYNSNYYYNNNNGWYANPGVSYWNTTTYYPTYYPTYNRCRSWGPFYACY